MTKRLLGTVAAAVMLTLASTAASASCSITGKIWRSFAYGTSTNNFLYYYMNTVTSGLPTVTKCPSGHLVSRTNRLGAVAS